MKQDEQAHGPGDSLRHRLNILLAGLSAANRYRSISHGPYSAAYECPTTSSMPLPRISVADYEVRAAYLQSRIEAAMIAIQEYREPLSRYMEIGTHHRRDIFSVCMAALHDGAEPALYTLLVDLIAFTRYLYCLENRVDCSIIYDEIQ
jgi:hypothetical protein